VESPKTVGGFSLTGLRVMLERNLEELPNLSDDGVWTGVVAGVDAVEEEVSGAESLLVDRLYELRLYRRYGDKALLYPTRSAFTPTSAEEGVVSGLASLLDLTLVFLPRTR
jgi:hypothetical protein